MLEIIVILLLAPSCPHSFRLGETQEERLIMIKETHLFLYVLQTTFDEK
jgi:hypothetical protein